MAFGNDPQAFPMMTVPLEVLITMTRMQSHEELMDAGALVNFQCLTLGKVMFVLHQWIARHHPDPDFEQLGVLQKALQNLINTDVVGKPRMDKFGGRLTPPQFHERK